MTTTDPVWRSELTRLVNLREAAKREASRLRIAADRARARASELEEAVLRHQRSRGRGPVVMADVGGERGGDC